MSAHFTDLSVRARTTELPELLGICDRIYALSMGRITGCLPRGQANQESLMELMTKEKEASVS